MNAERGSGVTSGIPALNSKKSIDIGHVLAGWLTAPTFPAGESTRVDLHLFRRCPER